MITVVNEENKTVICCKVSDLIDENYRYDRNAFIGKVGNGPDRSLYLVTWSEISEAKDTQSSYGPEASVLIERFVDLEITIKEQSRGNNKS